MAARQDILNLEADRKEPASWNIIHMFKEGSFWHAYEWSAWLICVITYNNEKHKRENTGDPIAVVHKPIGGKNQQGTYTMVGFQIKSLDKFVPNRLKLETVDDKQMDIEIELPHDDTPLTYERLQKAFEDWKGQQKLSKKDDDEGRRSCQATAAGPAQGQQRCRCSSARTNRKLWAARIFQNIRKSRTFRTIQSSRTADTALHSW